MAAEGERIAAQDGDGIRNGAERHLGAFQEREQRGLLFGYLRAKRN